MIHCNVIISNGRGQLQNNLIGLSLCWRFTVLPQRKYVNQNFPTETHETTPAACFCHLRSVLTVTYSGMFTVNTTTNFVYDVSREENQQQQRQISHGRNVISHTGHYRSST